MKTAALNAVAAIAVIAGSFPNGGVAIGQLDKEYNSRIQAEKSRERQCISRFRQAQFQMIIDDPVNKDYRYFIDKSDSVWRIFYRDYIPNCEEDRQGALHLEMRTRRGSAYGLSGEVIGIQWEEGNQFIIEGNLLVEYIKRDSGSVSRHERGIRR